MKNSRRNREKVVKMTEPTYPVHVNKYNPGDIVYSEEYGIGTVKYTQFRDGRYFYFVKYVGGNGVTCDDTTKLPESFDVGSTIYYKGRVKGTVKRINNRDPYFHFFIETEDGTMAWRPGHLLSSVKDNDWKPNPKNIVFEDDMAE